jgi:hypothetical protein
MDGTLHAVRCVLLIIHCALLAHRTWRRKRQVWERVTPAHVKHKESAQDEWTPTLQYQAGRIFEDIKKNMRIFEFFYIKVEKIDWFLPHSYV